MPPSRKVLSDCPVERCVVVLSGRWKARVLWRLFERPQAYAELARGVPGIPERVLSQALAELASDGVIRRKEDAWALTELGCALRPILVSMYEWGIRLPTTDGTDDD